MSIAPFVFSTAIAVAQVAPLPLDAPNTPGPALGQVRPGGRTAWMTGVLPLGDTARQNDFPSAAVAANGDVWVAWASYSGLRDEVHARRFSGGHWYAAFPIPGVEGDVWMPQVAIDAKGRPWFVWSQQTGYPRGDSEKPNWDLYATYWEDGAWGKITRLTDHPLPDINHHFISDSRGKLWLAWQGFRDGQSDIFLRSCEDGRWSEPAVVTAHPGNDWAPVVAVNSAGHASVAWDSYRNGNYDVFLRTLRGAAWSEEVAVASTPMGEITPTLAYDKQDRLWIAYVDVGVNWAKDSGGRSLGVKQSGTRIGDRRELRMAVLANGQWMSPVKEPTAAMIPGEENWVVNPKLTTDADGRIWLMFHHRVGRYTTWTWAVDSQRTPTAMGVRSYLGAYVTHYDGGEWIPASEMPRSRDRMSSTLTGAGAPNGQYWMFWHSDHRDDTAINVPLQNQIWSAVLTPISKPRPYELVPRGAAVSSAAAGALDPVAEAGDVKALRDVRITWNNQTLRLFKGDLHRHTELSTDGGGRSDGSILDFFRYMIDAAAMDYGAITDHSAGGDSEYWWWLIQKVTEMYHVPGRYSSLFGYERTPHWPKGHKNIIHATRNIPIVKLFTRPDMPEHWSTYAIVAGDLAKNDTSLLYDNVRRTGGIAIPHTLAPSQGNAWTETDDKVQPVAEIFQAARDSYEHEGAPGAHRPRGGGYAGGNDFNPAGFLWKAWEKGVRIGVIASSDHTSTHLSFALVYSADSTRAGIIEAIRARRTYGATENILLEYSMGGHFMGEEFNASEVPDIKLRVRGAGPISKVSIIRNGKYLAQFAPNARDYAISYRDTSKPAGSQYYYVRVEQADGNLAWSSPIWVNLP